MNKFSPKFEVTNLLFKVTYMYQGIEPPVLFEIEDRLVIPIAVMIWLYLEVELGSPHWKHSELFFEKKALIPALQQLLTTSQ